MARREKIRFAMIRGTWAARAKNQPSPLRISFVLDRLFAAGRPRQNDYPPRMSVSSVRGFREFRGQTVLVCSLRGQCGIGQCGIFLPTMRETPDFPPAAGWVC
jgi:hypothetical protein